MGLIPYLGGKRLLSKEIIRIMPQHICYVEVFAGGASVFFSKRHSKVEVLNDINNELITLYRVVQNHKEEFLKQFDFNIASRDEYERLLNVKANTLTDIQKAARFYYLQKLAFGGHVVGRHYGYTTTHSKLNYKTIEKSLNMVHERLQNVSIENLHYSEIIKRYDRPHTLFYLDPPYHKIEDYYGKNIFSEEDYKILSGLLRSISGKFIMSINDTDFMRLMYGNFNIKEVGVNYSLHVGKQTKTKELIITNF